MFPIVKIVLCLLAVEGRRDVSSWGQGKSRGVRTISGSEEENEPELVECPMEQSDYPGLVSSKIHYGSTKGCVSKNVEERSRVRQSGKWRLARKTARRLEGGRNEI
jgi:hypothetical protein